MQRIAIFGGTFNPVHNGHVIIAEHFIEEMRLDVCYFVPASISPFRTENAFRQLTPEIRLELVKLAIENNPKLKVDDYEIKQGGVSFTYQTIDYFFEKFPDSRFFLLIGDDQAKYFTDWKNWEEIAKKVQICIARRVADSEEKAEISKKLTVGNKPPLWLHTPIIEISATEILERIKEGKTIKYLVPEKVEEYLLKNRIY